MSKSRNIADLLDSSGDVKSGALDNVPASDDASSLTTGTIPIARIADYAVVADKLANSINTDIATGVTANTTANAALAKAGGTTTGDIRMNNKLSFNAAARSDTQVYLRNTVVDDKAFYIEGDETTAHTAHFYNNVSGSGRTGSVVSIHQDGAGAAGSALLVDSDGDTTAVFTGGNVGIGVTPESWNTVGPALQVGAVAALYSYSGSGDMNLGANYYYNSGEKYITSNYACRYRQVNGTHEFKVAPSGTADSAISWTDAMKIDNNGYITKPCQPIATSAWTGTRAANTIVPASNMLINTGSHLASNGRFTAPIAGTYWYSFTGMKASATSNLKVEIHKNGSTMSDAYVAYTNDPTYSRATSFGYVALAANDYLEFKLASGHATMHPSYGTINFALVA